ncbi:MAG TPA: ABC transporter permease [Lachnospiraceae bacterium]|nr:ABC transporter permease [Lachnospiraceae bacterium]
MNVIKSEIFKMIRKKEVYLFLVLVLSCSALFAVLMGKDSTSMQIQGLDKMGGEFFSVFLYVFLFELFLVPIIFAVVVVRTWASDFSNGTIAYDITLSNNRTVVFIGKVIISLGVCLVYTAILIGSAILFYRVLAASGKYYTSDLMYLVDDSYWKFLITSLLVVLFICAITTFFSMSENPTLSIILTIGLLMLFRLLEKVESIKQWIPTHLLNASNSLEATTEDFWIGVIVIVAISGGLYAVSYKIFKKKNIK